MIPPANVSSAMSVVAIQYGIVCGFICPYLVRWDSRHAGFREYRRLGYPNPLSTASGRAKMGLNNSTGNDFTVGTTLVVAPAGWRRRAVFGMSAPLSIDSEGRTHHDKMRRDVCATRAKMATPRYLLRLAFEQDLHNFSVHFGSLAGGDGEIVEGVYRPNGILRHAKAIERVRFEEVLPVGGGY